MSKKDFNGFHTSFNAYCEWEGEEFEEVRESDMSDEEREHYCSYPGVVMYCRKGD